MTASGTVAAGDLATAAQYNNLRADCVDTSAGHTHDGADSKVLATLGTASGHRHDGSDSRYVGMTSYLDSASSNTTLTNANQYYTVLSRSLTAGTWLVYGRMQGNGSIQGRLTNGTATYYAHASSYGAGGAGALHIEAVVTLGVTTPMTMQAAAAVTGGTVLAQLAANGDSTNDATQLVCVRLA